MFKDLSLCIHMSKTQVLKSAGGCAFSTLESNHGSETKILTLFMVGNSAFCHATTAEMPQIYDIFVWNGL